MVKQLSTRRLYAALALLWAMLVLVLTLTPAQDMPRTPEWQLLSFDTAAHAAVFAVLAGLSWLWARRQGRWLRLARQAGVGVLLGCLVFGALIEVLQYAMHAGRHAEWTDLLSDAIGAALALAVLHLATRSQRALLTVGLLLLAAQAQAQAPTPADLVRARHTIEVLASPKMHGRGYVQQGEHQAAAYLRGRLKQLGLQPLAPDYTQSFTLDVNTFPGKLTLRLAPSAVSTTEGVTLEQGRDFIVFPSCPPVRLRTFYLDFPDTLVYQNDTARVGWLLTSRLGPAASASALLVRPADILRLSRPENKDLAARYLGPAHPLLEVVPKLTASLAATQDSQPHVQILRKSLPPWAGQSNSVMELQVDAQLLHAYPTQNMAALIRGSAQPDSFLVISAHYDHLGMMGSHTYFPGANDNASGVALLLELAAHYARPENRPASSVVFLLFGAEEAGLVGSGYFVQHPLVPLARIKFLLNLDLLGTGEEGATVVNGRLLPAAFARLTALNEAHHYLPRLTARGAAANSDHFPFSQAGVPAFFLYTRGGSTAYHDVNDRPAALSLAGFAGAYGLARDFLDSLGAHR